MDERGIIIADKDGKYRKELASFFKEAGYAVETTDSAAHVLCSILEKQTPVLLLGSDFDKKVSSTDLIHLLKKCNRNLSVIMVSENLPLEQARQVRQEGIFYHALKPVSAADTEELGLAVECAFKKGVGGEEGKANAALQDVQPPVELSQAALQSDVCCCGEEPGREGKGIKTLWWFVGLVVLVLGISCLSLVAAESASEGSSMAIWLFLTFCALIIATQLLPIFRAKLPARWSLRETTKLENDSQEQK